jgi:hypothetical protein
MKAVFLVSLFCCAVRVSAAPVYHDVVVYGGTSGGVMAAVQAARSGRSVVLISPTAHLGGMTASGLGWTDLGNASILGGLSREFYHRLYLYYQDAAAWDWQPKERFGNAGQGGPAFHVADQVASVFEPSAAEAVFAALIREAGVPVITGRLDLASGVVMQDRRISQLRLEDGREVAGRIFIDASYEGDLLPGAGVRFTVGREANAAHGETYSGIQTARAVKNQLPDGIDPYVAAGDPASGLLPGINPDAGGPDGAGDARLQAYCFRMVLTDVAENRVAIAQPEGYDEADYELLFRAIEAGQRSGFFKFDLMPNRKTDSNNSGGISTDFIGRNYGDGWNWATLDHDGREALAAAHEQWQRGLVWTLQHHPRVPVAIRDAHAAWGLPADEFTDNGNWPWQLYIRECRRMVSDVVMSQAHCSGVRAAPDSIGLAAYTMDSHNVQRHVADGMVLNEGDVQMPVPRPYPVSYRAIVPARGECANLLVPWSLSASHMAFGSIRMEPVFMTLAQSAAIAADLAITHDIDVQDVAYAELRPALLNAGQALGEPISPGATPTTIIDNADAANVIPTGEWLASAAIPGFVGADYLHDNNTAQGEKQVFFRIRPDAPGDYRVFLRWTSHENRATAVPIEIRHAAGATTSTINQRAEGGRWHPLGIYRFSGADGEGLLVTTTGADGHVIADAVGFSPAEPDADSDAQFPHDTSCLLPLDSASSTGPIHARYPTTFPCLRRAAVAASRRRGHAASCAGRRSCPVATGRVDDGAGSPPDARPARHHGAAPGSQRLGEQAQLRQL